MNKIYLYLFIIILSLFFIYIINKIFKCNNEYFGNDNIEVFTDSQGNIPDGYYYISIDGTNNFLSYEFNTTNYLTNLYVQETTQTLQSTGLDISGKLAISNQRNQNSIFKIKSNILYTSNGKSNFYITSRYGIVPNDVYPPMMTIAQYYIPPENLYTFLQIKKVIRSAEELETLSEENQNGLHLGGANLFLTKLGTVNILAHRAALFHFYNVPKPTIVIPTIFNNPINVANNVTPGIYFIKFRNVNKFLGYDYTIETNNSFVSPKLKKTDLSGYGGIITTNDLSNNNIFYIDKNRALFTYDLFSDTKYYFSPAFTNNNIQIPSMVNSDMTDFKGFLPLYLNMDSTIVGYPQQSTSEPYIGQYFYMKGIDAKGLTTDANITYDNTGCPIFPNKNLALFDLFPITLNGFHTIIDSLYNTPKFIESKLIIAQYKMPPQLPYKKYSLTSEETSYTNPLTSNLSSVDLSNLTSGLYYINFNNTTAFLGYSLNPTFNTTNESVTKSVTYNFNKYNINKFNSFINSNDVNNIIFYIDTTTDIIYTVDNTNTQQYYFYYNISNNANIISTWDPSLVNIQDNTFKIIKNPLNNKLFQLRCTDFSQTQIGINVNGQAVNNTQYYTYFKLYPVISNNQLNNILINPNNITPGLYYIKFKYEDADAYLTFDPTARSYYSCMYSSNYSGIITKTNGSDIYNTPYNLFYIDKDNIIYTPDENGNPLYTFDAINENKTIILINKDLANIGHLQINSDGTIGRTTNIIINYNAQLDFKDLNNITKFQILKALPQK